MPRSLSHVVVVTDDLDTVVRFLTEVARMTGVVPYDAGPETLRDLFGWPVEHGPARGAFVGEGPGSVDVLEIPGPLRGSVTPGVRLLAVTSRDAVAGGEAASAAGFAVRGPFHTAAATGQPMSLVEVVAGGIPFELVQFG